MENPQSKQINPWTHIWTKPRETIRYLIDTAPTRAILWLAILGGIVSALSWLSLLWTQYPHQEEFHRALFLFIFAIFGAALGIVNLYFGAWLYKLTGAWVGGKGTFIDVKCAVGWGNYLFILAGILSIFSFLVVPNPWLQFIFGLANFIVLIWGIVVLLLMLAEAHRFSLWRALWTILIAAALLFIVAILIALLVPLLSPLISE